MSTLQKRVKVILYTTILLAILAFLLAPDIEKKERGVLPQTTIEKEQQIEPKELFSQTKKAPLKNLKLLVNAGEDQNITMGTELTLEATVEKREGEMLSYVWREGNETLSQEQSFSTKLSKGRHELQVTVRDNQGFEGEDNVTVNVGYYRLSKIIYYNKSMPDGIAGKYEYDEAGHVSKLLLDRELDGEYQLIRSWRYNKDGEEIEFIGYSDEEKSLKRTTAFDAEGNILEKHTLRWNEFGELSKDRLVTYRYNETGEKEEKRTVDGLSSESFTNFYEYDEDQLLSEIEKNSEDKVLLTRHYSYYANGELAEVSFEDDDYSSLTQYREDGKLRSKHTKGIFERNETYHYNDEGLLVESLTQVKNGYTENILFSYDEQQRLISEEVKDQSRSTYSYDENGAKTHTYFSKGEGESFKKLREEMFDAEGRWIEKREYKGEEEKVVHFVSEKTTKNIVHLFYSSYGDFNNIHEEEDEIFYPSTDVTYDDYGNIIEIRDGNGSIVEKRTYRFVIG